MKTSIYLKNSKKYINFHKKTKWNTNASLKLILITSVSKTS